MFRDVAHHQQSIRSQENAAIARWFSPSPLGLLFHATDGTTRPIARDVAEARRHQGERIVEDFVADMPAQAPLFIGMIIAGIVLAWCIADLFGLSKSGAIAFGFGAGAAAAHFWEFYQVAVMRQRLHALRAAITHDLRAAVPVPLDMAGRYQRHNPYQRALQILCGAFGVYGLIAMHDERVLMAVPMIAWLVFVPVVWLLFALARHRDATTGVTRRKL